MKRFTLILVLVILLSLAIATPVLAGGPDHPGNACPNIPTWGWMKGFWNQLEKFGTLKGRFYGSCHAYRMLCLPY